ncbi:MAG: CBS domain-containing protein, partial [bacterium]
GDLKIQTAFLEASRTPITNQVTPLKQLPVESVRMDAKRGVEEIPRLISSKTEALYFELGYGRYYGPAIEQYLTRLSEYPFFKYITIRDSDRKFIGMADAKELNMIFSDYNAGFSSHDFARWINESEIASLSKLPGFVSAKDAIKKDTDKQTVLEKMEKLNIEILPVIDEQDRFSGIVDRSRLTASLIIDVANKVK